MMGNAARRGLVAAGILLISAAAAAAQPGTRRDLVIAAGPPGTLYYALASGVAKLLADYGRFRVVVQPYSGSSTYLPLLNAGELQLGPISAVEVAMAYQGPDRLKVAGRNPYPPAPNVRLVVRGGPVRVAQWARRESVLRSVSDLRGRRVTGVYSANLGVWLSSTAILASCNLSWNDVQVIPVSTVSEGMRALVAGRADSALHALGSVDVQEADAAVGVRALSVCGDEQGQRRLREAVPGYYAIGVRAGQSPGVTEDLWVAAYDVYLVTHKSLDENTVYEVTRTLWEQNRKLWPLHRAFEEWATRRYVDPGVTVPYHSGAVRLYREKGAWDRRMDEVQARLLRESGR
jgi:TRAP transporter TAXI family solute receptor